MSEVKLGVPVDDGNAAHQCYMVACHAKAQTILGDRPAGLTVQNSRAVFSIVDCPNDLLQFDIERNSSLSDLHIRSSTRLMRGWMLGAAVSGLGNTSRICSPCTSFMSAS